MTLTNSTTPPKNPEKKDVGMPARLAANLIKQNMKKEKPPSSSVVRAVRNLQNREDTGNHRLQQILARSLFENPDVMVLGGDDAGAGPIAEHPQQGCG